MSDKSYSLLSWFCKILGNFVNLAFNVASTSSGLPYLSSNLSHRIDNPRTGSPGLADFMLTALLEESFPKYLINKSSSSPAFTPSSDITDLKLFFHVRKVSGESSNFDNLVSSKSRFNRWFENTAYCDTCPKSIWHGVHGNWVFAWCGIEQGTGLTAHASWEMTGTVWHPLVMLFDP